MNRIACRRYQTTQTVRGPLSCQNKLELVQNSNAFVRPPVVFLTEVIDSLERGYKEKTNPDFLILEINSSRYAYNMSLSEVNFYVVKALLNLYPIKEADGNMLTAFNQIFAQLNGVLKNYIRGDQAMTDCLKAIEVSFHLLSL